MPPDTGGWGLRERRPAQSCPPLSTPAPFCCLGSPGLMEQAILPPRSFYVMGEQELSCVSEQLGATGK